MDVGAAPPDARDVAQQHGHREGDDRGSDAEHEGEHGQKDDAGAEARHAAHGGAEEGGDDTVQATEPNEVVDAQAREGDTIEEAP